MKRKRRGKGEVNAERGVNAGELQIIGEALSGMAGGNS
jgi:hypothetical protein